MKKVLTYLCIAAACIITSVSCNKAALSKSEVEAGFAAKGPVPTVTIDKNIPVEVTVATVNVTFAGISEASSDSLSIGVLVSSDPTFYKSKFYAAETLADGTYAVECEVEPNATVYFRGVAANVNGTNYSETVSIVTPDVPFWAKVGGVYGCTEFSERYGDSYEGHSIIIVVNDDHTTCTIGNLEPYYAGEGYLYPDMNYVSGVLDNDAQTITVKAGASMHLGTLAVASGDTPSIATASGFTDLFFRMQADGSLVRDNCMIILYGGEIDDAYAGGVVFRK